MSGQPVNTQSDIKKFRQEYLATLAFQEKINDKNFQANQVFQKIGVPSQPTDTRTTEEKEKDTFLLRQQVRGKLSQIADGLNSDLIIQSLDNNELVFLANQIDRIISEIKPQFQLGIPAEAFIDYLTRYMRLFEENKGVELTKGLLGSQQDVVSATAVIPDKMIEYAGEQFSYINPQNIQSSGIPTQRDLINYLNAIESIMTRQRLYEGFTEGKVKRTKTSIKSFLETKDELIKTFFTIPMMEQVASSSSIFETPIKPFDASSRSNSGKSGRGLVKPKSYKRSDQLSNGDIDWKSGIEQPQPKYVPFGRFIINKNQLDKDIVAIKRPSGAMVRDMKSVRVSKRVANIMRKVIGGGIPNYDDISNLDDEEKGYLHKVMKQSNLLDKINIPSPSKDIDEAEIHLFETLRGQIIAGNDSNELLVKFKKVIMRLSDKQLLPKGQVRDMLLELAKNGY
jgi:hypothetical protein